MRNFFHTSLLGILFSLTPLSGHAALAGDSLPAKAIILAAGDVAQCATTGAMQTAALIQTLPGTVLALGDLAYPKGSNDNFSQCYEPYWGKFKARTLPAPGNHEYLTPDASGYFEYFGERAGKNHTGYYSINIGQWHIVSLNSNIDSGPDSIQAKWLQNDLVNNRNTCILAFWHHPRFSSGKHGNSIHMSTLWSILYDHHASIVLAGHDHHYERFAPLNKAGQRDEKHGIRSFVVGTGGAKLYEIESPEPGSEARYNGSWGILQLTLNTDSYGWQYIPVGDSQFQDSGTGRCVTQ
ncbi:metallophosphoesterase [Sulfurirhabdus autotrophica]|uniref:Calcineurin-like phosphoesterase family protein n=1 Tax=Sulfurirhabdus autotrophica TaxID=1706046 RepID=A0A4R3Y7D0_9PROT|nr:metallophosphoesterase [Sulfurirhabdus autotrophica]TCV87421.1 calcineurin-like phosphoesterase family protein [Sulfurirhabdus autotrophica]